MVNEQQLEKKNKQKSSNLSNLVPRRGSLPADYNRPTPQNPRFFSPQLENFTESEAGEILDELVNKNKGYSDKILNKLLEEKEREVERLETEKQQLLVEKQTWEKEQVKHRQVEKSLLAQNKKIEELKNEVRETGEDMLQSEEKNDELKTRLAEERLTNRQLEQRLNREIDENDWLRSSFKQTKAELSEKVNELTQLKKITQQEKEQWQKVFTEQEEKYELEKKDREEKFAHQINNLRTFQINTDVPLSMGRGRSPTHKRIRSTNSLPTSRSNSPRGSTLFLELSRTNFFNPPLTSSPLRNDDTDPLEEVGTSQTDFSQVFEDLMSEVNDFTNKTSQDQVNNQELLTEIKQLKENQLHLEKNYKILADEKVEAERALKHFNEKELIWVQKSTEYERLLQVANQEKLTLENTKQKLSEELAEMKYQLAESQKRVEGLEKSEKKTRYQLKEKHRENEELNNNLAEVNKKVLEKEAIKNLKSRLLVAKQEADELGQNIYQAQILINKK